MSIIITHHLGDATSRTIDNPKRPRTTRSVELPGHSNGTEG